MGYKNSACNYWLYLLVVLILITIAAGIVGPVYWQMWFVLTFSIFFIYLISKSTILTNAF